jgi:maltokinase
VTPGTNPDIEILAALSQAGSEHVATLYGYVETDDPGSGEVVQLGILQQFLRTASDGWDIALASLRDLLADEAMHAQDAGGDFASESHRLGVALAEMHQTLADAFPTEPWDRTDLARLAEAMSARLDAATEVVPGIEPHASALHAIFDAVRHHPGPVTAQRVHGDLHLGQTLHTPHGWLVIDFEGEPAAPLAERVRPDPALRDVAGMLFSFDYAAFHHLLQSGPLTGAHPDRHRADGWAARNRAAFCAGYARRAGTDPREHGALLRAFELDKAVYQVLYETRSRPTWVSIPLATIARLTSEAPSHSTG